MAKDTYWFKHDSNARMDEKTLELRAVYGWEGYGIYWAIIETLREQDGYSFSMSKLGGLSVAIGKDREWTEKFIRDCVSIGLLCIDGEVFYSRSLKDRMKEWDTMRQSNRKAAEVRWNSNGNADAMQVHTECKADAMPIREDKIREDKKKEYNAFLRESFMLFYSAYPRKKSPKDAEKAWNSLKPSPELVTQIMAAIDDQKRERAAKTMHGLFTPEWKYPASWLRAEAWKDETMTAAQILAMPVNGKAKPRTESAYPEYK